MKNNLKKLNKKITYNFVSKNKNFFTSKIFINCLKKMEVIEENIDYQIDNLFRYALKFHKEDKNFNFDSAYTEKSIKYMISQFDNPFEILLMAVCFIERVNGINIHKTLPVLCIMCHKIYDDVSCVSDFLVFLQISMKQYTTFENNFLGKILKWNIHISNEIFNKYKKISEENLQNYDEYIFFNRLLEIV